MFNLLLALMVGVVIGWSLNSFFIKLNSYTIVTNDINLSKKTYALKTNTKTKIKKEDNLTITNAHISKKFQNQEKKKSPIESFSTLLERGLFSDAIALYLDAESKKLPLYHSILTDYFTQKGTTDINLAIYQMHEFIELEPENRAVILQLIKLYQSTQEYKKSIALIDKLILDTSPSEVDILYTMLIENSESYIDKLKSSKKFHTMVSFLEERIELGTQTPFYTYILAEYYVEIKKYLLATQLLKEIEFDEEYSEKAENLLELIHQKESENSDYKYKLPLKKDGDHFTIDVTIDNTSLVLLLDTGASLTMIDRDKISSLKVVNENITLQTAGGEINAQLQIAETFTIGEIELKEFQVVSTLFEQQNTDGLLGMNFFKRFKFKIDQEESMLYLSKKRDTNNSI